jgi:hypothetical protein
VTGPDRTPGACFDTRPGLSRELAGQGWPQAIAQRRFRAGPPKAGRGPRPGSPLTSQLPSKSISRLAKLASSANTGAHWANTADSDAPAITHENDTQEP